MSGPEKLLPPEEMLAMFGGERGFTEQGQKWVGLFREFCGLQPGERVLDVGCGAGRMAIPLGDYLSAEGGYDGLDIVREAIDWCRQNITPRRPNFRFQHADVFNKAFNPEGTVAPASYTFPYEDEQFDFVVLVSVFTHMLTDEVERYLAEITRVLEKGGRCLISFLLLNDESLRALEAEQSSQALPRGRRPGHNPRRRLTHDFGHYRLANPEVPESLVAYDEDFVLGLYDRVGLEVRQPVQYGRWSGREADAETDGDGPDQGFMMQDCILAHRPSG